MAPSPRFSLLTPVFDPVRAYLRRCLESVRAQSFDDWEHIVVDDGSTGAWVGPLLDKAAAADPRIRVIHRSVNGGIVAASRDALAAASGEVVALLDHDDVLEADALASMDAVMTPDVDAAYSDHDFIDPDGFYVDAAYK